MAKPSVADNTWAHASWVPPKRESCVNSTKPECRSNCTLFDISTGLPRNLKILIFVDPVFLDLFLNWLHFYHDTCGRSSAANLEVVCMGNFTEEGRILGYYGIECSSLSFDLAVPSGPAPSPELLMDIDNQSFTSTSANEQAFLMNTSTAASPILWSDKHLTDNKKKKKLYSIWDQRLSIISTILESGVDVMLTDSDAIWMRNPFREIEFYSQQSDIVASKGYAPWDISGKWGASLCMGFIYLKASPFTVELFRRIEHAVDKLKVAAYSLNRSTAEIDDQHLINRELLAWNISWPPNMTVAGAHAHTGHVKYVEGNMNNHSYNNNSNNMSSSMKSIHEQQQQQQQQYNVTLLPHSSYVRYCVSFGENWLKNTITQHREIHKRLSSAKIAHCQLASGRQDTKEVFLRMFKLWKHNYSNFVGVIPARMTQAIRDPFFYSDEVSSKNKKFGPLFEARVASHNSIRQFYAAGEINIASLNSEQKMVLEHERAVIESMIVHTPYEQLKLQLNQWRESAWRKIKDAVFFVVHPRRWAKSKKRERDVAGKKISLSEARNKTLEMLRLRIQLRRNATNSSTNSTLLYTRRNSSSSSSRTRARTGSPGNSRHGSAILKSKFSKLQAH